MHREDGSLVDALDLDTPALYVDVDVLEHNIARMPDGRQLEGRCTGEGAVESNCG